MTIHHYNDRFEQKRAANLHRPITPCEELALIIQRARGDNYPVHYDIRHVVLAMPADLISDFSDLAQSLLTFPSLNIFGATSSNWIPPQADQLIHKIWTPAMIQIFNPWYLSAEGWENFQEQWKALPEPEDLPLSLWISTMKPVDKWLKSVDNLLITCGQLTNNSASYPQSNQDPIDISPLFKKLSTACGQMTTLSTGLSTVCPQVYAK